MDGAEPGGGVEESVFLSCDRATVRANARLGLVDEEDLAGEVGRMGVAGEREEAVVAEMRGRHLTTPPPRTAECRALRSRRVVKSSDLKDEELQHGRLDKHLKQRPAQLEVVGTEQQFVAQDDVKDIMEG